MPKTKMQTYGHAGEQLWTEFIQRKLTSKPVGKKHRHACAHSRGGGGGERRGGRERREERMKGDKEKRRKKREREEKRKKKKLLRKRARHRWRLRERKRARERERRRGRRSGGAAVPGRLGGGAGEDMVTCGRARRPEVRHAPLGDNPSSWTRSLS